MMLGMQSNPVITTTAYAMPRP